jgi:DNA repair exonuclease SbcCD nuclease subunit
MKCLFFSDLHMHAWSQFSTTLPNGRNSRVDDQLKVLSQIREICVREKVATLFFLGDCFHSRTKIDGDLYSVTWTAFKSLSEVVDNFYILVGNHDQNNRVGDSHSLSAFRAFAHVVDSPICVRFGPVGDSVNIALFPFTTEIKDFKTFVRNLPRVDFFLFHQGMSQAQIGAFDVYIKAEVELNDLPDRARYRLAGHYHRHQWLDSRTAYIGSPLQLNFGERDEEKGFILVDTQRDTRLHIPSEAPRFYVTEYSNFNPDRYRMVRDFVKVMCRGLNEMEELKHKYPRVQTELVEGPISTLSRLDPNVICDDSRLIGAYLANSKTDPLDPKRLEDLGLELLMGDNDE